MCTVVKMPQSFAELPPVITTLLCGDKDCTDIRADCELADQFAREAHY